MDEFKNMNYFFNQMWTNSIKFNFIFYKLLKKGQTFNKLIIDYKLALTMYNIYHST
jgi:hypothetical protein